jgi:glycerol 3-phosphatase-1
MFSFSPDPYALGAKLSSVDPKRCIVFEDAPSGILSGAAAGCQTLAVITSHTRAQLEVVKPTFLVNNLLE